MKIATWNVNSIRQREAHVQRWLQSCAPDILILQEIKCEAAAFPALTFRALGYQAEAVGQKAYNGGAVLGRIPFTVTHRALPGLPEDDAQARYIEIQADGITIAGIYLPNGNSRGEDGFAYKLAWMDRLADRAEALLEADIPLVITGDFNVAPTDSDVWDPAAFVGSTHVSAPERQAIEDLLALGLTDVQPRALKGEPFTYWDYRAGMFHKGLGMRIALVLASAQLAAAVRDAYVDRDARKGTKPSDHAPVVVDLQLPGEV